MFGILYSGSGKKDNQVFTCMQLPVSLIMSQVNQDNTNRYLLGSLKDICISVSVCKIDRNLHV